MVVTLSPEEVKIAQFLAKQRTSNNRSSGVKENLVASESKKIQAEMDGILAEFAFGKKFNLWPDMTTHIRSGGYDFLLRNGKTLDVKTTRHSNGRLITYPGKKQKSCDLYVLTVTLSENTVDIVGFATKEQLFDDSNIVDLGYGPTYVLERNKLTTVTAHSFE